MKIQVTILAIVLGISVVACTPALRYRNGSERKSSPTKKVKQGALTTNDSLRLGVIMRSYLGRPYAGKSRDGRGLDCSGFTRKVFNEYGLKNIPRTTERQVETGLKVSRHQLQYGDLVFFKTGRDRVGHVGIYVGINQFMHASTSQGVIVSKLSEEYWKERYVVARRILP